MSNTNRKLLLHIFFLIGSEYIRKSVGGIANSGAPISNSIIQAINIYDSGLNSSESIRFKSKKGGHMI